MLQLSPTDETRKTAKFYTGCLPIKRQLQSRNTQLYHHHAHWCAQIEKIWQYWIYRVAHLLDAAEMILLSYSPVLHALPGGRQFLLADKMMRQEFQLDGRFLLQQKNIM
eukprot:131196-Ditylum_brightwellii.AAC.1